MKKYIPLFLFTLFAFQIYATPKIMFIHGMFLNRETWKEWELYFQSKGWETMSPAWPGKDMIGMANRNETDHSVEAGLTFSELVNYYDSILATMPEQPYLVGHSMGGLIVQHLLQRGKGRAAVIISSAPPHGIKTKKLSFLKANWPALNPFQNHQNAYLMPYKRFAQYMFNGTGEVPRTLWRRYIVYESFQVWRAPLHNVSEINFTKKIQPLLIIGAEKDRIVPETLNRKNYKKYTKNNHTITEYKQLKGASHLAVLSSEWKLVAEEVYNFLSKY